jgi:hypothetical protein
LRLLSSSENESALATFQEEMSALVETGQKQLDLQNRMIQGL